MAMQPLFEGLGRLDVFVKKSNIGVYFSGDLDLCAIPKQYVKEKIQYMLLRALIIRLSSMVLVPNYLFVPFHFLFKFTGIH